jgi:hypothetical protein
MNVYFPRATVPSLMTPLFITNSLKPHRISSQFGYISLEMMTSETTVNFYETARPIIPEDGHHLQKMYQLPTEINTYAI